MCGGLQSRRSWNRPSDCYGNALTVRHQMTGGSLWHCPSTPQQGRWTPATRPANLLLTRRLPFAPFTAVLRDLVHEMGADGVASMLPGRTTRGLARLLPELGEPDTGGDPEEARARLDKRSRATFTVRGRAGAPARVVLVGPDWATPLSQSRTLRVPR